MTIHISDTPPTVDVAGTKRISHAFREFIGSAAHVSVDVVAFGLFIVGGQDQRRMVEWTRRHS